MSECVHGTRCVVRGMLIVAICAVRVLNAHDFSQSESRLEFAGNDVRVQLRLNLLELKDVDRNVDRRVSYDELDQAIEQVFATIKSHYVVAAEAEPSRISAEKFQIVDDHVLQIDIRYAFDRRVRHLDVTSRFDAVLGPAHQHFATAVVNGERRRSVLDSANRTMTIETGRVTVGRVAVVVGAALGLALLGAYRLRQRSRASSW